MMNLKPWRWLGGSVVLLLVMSWPAGAARPAPQATRRSFRAGEVIVYCQTGTPQTDVNALAAAVGGASVTALRMADCYKFTLPSLQQNDGSTLSAVATLKADARVRWAGADRIYYALATAVPNDADFSQQWNLSGTYSMNMPAAWVIQKGQPNHNVCVIDTGFDTTHPDLQKTFLADSYDVASGVSIAPNGTGGLLQHGVHVSGIIAANTNNLIGVAGVCWQNVHILGLKVVDSGDTTGALDSAAVLNAYAYLTDRVDSDHIVALNMSYGGTGDPTDTTDPEYIALDNLYVKGVALVAAAGNSAADNHTQVPSAFPFVISVGATGPKGEIAAYSSYGKVDVAAPGGDDTTSDSSNTAAQILSTRDGAYFTEQGTSMAAPHVVGLLALLLSTPGVTRDEAISAMKKSANTSNQTTVPDPYFGYGRVDAYQALLRVSVEANILAPSGVDQYGNTTDPSGVAQPSPTFEPTISVQISGAPPSDVTIAVDPSTSGSVSLTGAALPVVSGDSTSSTPVYTVQFRVPFQYVSPSVHEVLVTATNPTTAVKTTSTLYFTLAAESLQPQSSGFSMVSFPYYQSATDLKLAGQVGANDDGTASTVLGPGATLYRYAPSASTPYIVYTDTQVPSTYVRPLMYAFNPGSDPYVAQIDPYYNPTTKTYVGPSIYSAGSASYSVGGGSSTIGNTPYPIGTTLPPLGIGYFLKNTASVSVVSYGEAQTTATFQLPLQQGWNMIGNPFPFAVAFNATQVVLPGGATEPTQTAAQAGLIKPFIYRYLHGQYQVAILPQGILAPWESAWIYVPTSTSSTLQALIVPPASTSSVNVGKAIGATSTARSTIASGTAPKLTGSGSWALQLQAGAGSFTDANNYIGMSGTATEGEDNTKVPKPPKFGPYVNLGLTRSAAPGALYMQDLRPLGGTRTWNVTVATDQGSVPVNLTWPSIASVPRSYRLTLTDSVSGMTIDLRKQTSYRFTSAKSGGARAFVLTAEPAQASARAVVTNITVNRGRTTSRGISAYDIGYTVTQDATVEATLLTFNGQRLAALTGARAVTRGDNHLAWNGHDNAGRVLPIGSYMLQLRAITSDGSVTRVTQPLQIDR